MGQPVPDAETAVERVPDHPVYLRGLHGYAVGAIDSRSAREDHVCARAPAGSEIARTLPGRRAGSINAAVKLLESAIPAAAAQVEALVLKGTGGDGPGGVRRGEEAGATAS